MNDAVPNHQTIELTILMPCLNEAETLAICINKAFDYLARSGVAGEVVIADNGSTDGSQEIARTLGARVVDISARGYGAALQGGIQSARGTYIIMGDSDDSYDFSSLDPFIAKLRDGYDLVMGNRFAGGIRPGAMPKLHRYLGNPVLTAIGRIFFRSPCRDFHCGLRGFRRDSALALGLQCDGMEFASEMVVKATIMSQRITEVPTILSPDGRSRPPHLKSWRDGWRHLRFLLLFSPRWLFLYPGFAMMCFGILMGGWLLPGPRSIAGITLDVHTLSYAAASAIVGYQSVLFWVCAKVYGVRERIVPPDPWFDRVAQQLTVERALMVGGGLLILGLGLGIVALGDWRDVGFGNLSPSSTFRLIIPSTTALVIAFQTIYSAFFVSILGIQTTRSPVSPQ